TTATWIRGEAPIGSGPGPLATSSPPLPERVIAARTGPVAVIAAGDRKRYVWPFAGDPGVAEVLLPKSKIRCHALANGGVQATHASIVALGPSVEIVPEGSVTP